MKNKQIEKHENGFEFDEIKTFKNKKRFLLNNEPVAKTCCLCERELPISCFRKKIDGFAGVRNICKSCQIVDNRRYDIKPPGKSLKLAYIHNSRARLNGNIAGLNADEIESLFMVSQAGLKKENKFRCLVSGETVERIYIGHIISVDTEGGHSIIQNLVPISNMVNCNQGKQTLWNFLITDKGKELANKVCIRWLVRYIANINCKKVERYLLEFLEEKELSDFLNYYELQNKKL